MKQADKARSLKRLVMRCDMCGCGKPDKGRALNGARAYRCKSCGATWVWSFSHKKRYSPQRPGNQFHDTGAASHNAEAE